ncbi:1-phosphatidylinositol-4-phosphate 5-kinases [Striga asiatica]|uniref:1-phosphatidylinositol-4-phosphate 5-kinases n=1 Tax=Striga asiatica TaxID=4170 RepID=A0A5A7RGW9_STRAF|nr:1-phosphatidylinositol-4-phosphate 5-kinases [Striga asiatica]
MSSSSTSYRSPSRSKKNPSESSQKFFIFLDKKEATNFSATSKSCEPAIHEHQKTQFQARRFEDTRDAPNSGEYQEHQAIHDEAGTLWLQPSAKIGALASCAIVAMFQDTVFPTTSPRKSSEA